MINPPFGVNLYVGKEMKMDVAAANDMANMANQQFARLQRIQGIRDINEKARQLLAFLKEPQYLEYSVRNDILSSLGRLLESPGGLEEELLDEIRRSWQRT
ncbi:MAG: hypothetical protein PHR51_00950 [Patescibacteria group bacterium]|nr:hypothetical protein [Patescibacteria group bacterium]